MQYDCIFCKIINKEIKAHFVDENETCIVIKDAAPKAPVHYLIIPKKHYKDIQSLPEHEIELAGTMLFQARKLAKDLGQGGDFRLIVNSGENAGQRVFHLHFHFIAGKRFVDF